MRLAVLGSVLAVSTATAAAEPTRTEHYGAQMLVIDGISVGLLAGGVGLLTLESDAKLLGLLPFALGAVGYLYVTPAAHLGYDRLWTARTSYVMRLVAPVSAMVIGANLPSCAAAEADSFCRREKIGAIVGLGAGLLAWSTFDAFVLARADVPVVYVAPSGDSASVGLAGRF